MASIIRSAYTRPQRVLHWGMALLVLFNLLLADGIGTWNRLTRTGQALTPEQMSAANLHAYVGIAILVLAVLRLCLRLISGAPPAPENEPAVARIASKIAHAAFYILLFAMPMAGIGKYYFGNDIAGFIHGGPLKTLLWVLIAAHVAAALVHQFYWKTNVLQRMTTG